MLAVVLGAGLVLGTTGLNNLSSHSWSPHPPLGRAQELI